MRTPMPTMSPNRSSFLILLVCFFFSGAAGLIYQVAWSKALGLVFGYTAYAVATVLAVFMGGMAAGSAWFGRWSRRTARPLAAYGWLELAVAVTGAVSLPGIAGVRFAYIAAYPHSSGVVLLALRFAGAAGVLFLPAFLMGGTLPMLVRGLASLSAGLGSRFARLYWVNTAGAVAGTLAAGFLFLPILGLRATLGVAVTLNVLAGVLALRFGRPDAAGNTIPSARPAKRRTPRFVVPAPEASLPQRALLMCFGVVGATAMAYEIGWTRLLATQLGSSTYAFTLMLATFLAGIVLGSALFELWCQGHEAGQPAFALTQTATALAALASLVFFPRLLEILPAILQASRDSFQRLIWAQLAVCALVMLPTAAAFGFNFPLVTVLIAKRESTTDGGDGAVVGRAYAWNTLGAILGALAGGFWLLPRLGSLRLLAASAGVNVALAALLWIISAPRRIAACAMNLVIVLAVGVIGYSNYFFDPEVAAFNTLIYWNSTDRPLTVREKARMADVVYFADGLNATISVAQTDDLLTLRTNGKVDASTDDFATQLMLGHIGAVAHPAPHRVLVIGFGGGMTLSALARYPEIERLDCVEIEPAVVRAAPFLGPLNRNVLRDPRVHIQFDDARSFLFTTRERYDVIVSEPSNPWIAGIASLFTQEFYRAARAHLAPGGIFVQWVHAYSLYADDLRMILATFLSEFQGATLWHGNAPDFLLMAPTPPARQILNRMRTLWSSARLREDFDWMGIEEPEGLFGYYLLDDAGLRNFSSGGRINTDDLTLLEYRAPRALLIQGLEVDNRREVLLAAKDVLPADLEREIRGAVLSACAATSVNLQDMESAGRFLHALESRPVMLRSAIVRGRAAIARGDMSGAARAFDDALGLDPGSIEAAWGRAEVNRLSGNTVLAGTQLEQILEHEPGNLRALNSQEQLYSDTSRWSEAADVQRRLIAANPRLAAHIYEGADAYAQLGEMLKRAGRLEDAYAAMEACLQRDPYNFQTHLNLGQLFTYQKKWSEARSQLEFVRRFFPDADSQTYALLYEVYHALGNPEAAAEAVRFGARMFPDDSDLLRLKLLP